MSLMKKMTESWKNHWNQTNWIHWRSLSLSQNCCWRKSWTCCYCFH